MRICILCILIIFLDEFLNETGERTIIKDLFLFVVVVLKLYKLFF